MSKPNKTMSKAKVISITDDCIKFDNGAVLFSDHDQDCCESHELYFRDLTLSEFDGLEFDLSGEGFFKRIDGYGIELIPIQGHSVRIAGHGSNNGWYSTNLTLVLSLNGEEKKFDITECQDIKE